MSGQDEKSKNAGKSWFSRFFGSSFGIRAWPHQLGSNGSENAASSPEQERTAAEQMLICTSGRTNTRRTQPQRATTSSRSSAELENRCRDAIATARQLEMASTVLSGRYLGLAGAIDSLLSTLYDSLRRSGRPADPRQKLALGALNDLKKWCKSSEKGFRHLNADACRKVEQAGTGLARAVAGLGAGSGMTTAVKLKWLQFKIAEIEKKIQSLRKSYQEMEELVVRAENDLKNFRQRQRLF